MWKSLNEIMEATRGKGRWVQGPIFSSISRYPIPTPGTKPRRTLPEVSFVHLGRWARHSELPKRDVHPAQTNQTKQRRKDRTMATKTKKPAAKPAATKAIVKSEKVEIAFTASESKAIDVLTSFGTEAVETLGRIEKLGDRFQRAYKALATLPKEKWDNALTQAKIPATSSHYSSLKRAALDPKAADKALSTAGNLHGAIKLLPHQPTKSGKKTGRPEKTDAQKTKEQTMKAVKFLCSTYDQDDIHTLIDKHYKEFDKSASEEEIED